MHSLDPDHGFLRRMPRSQRKSRAPKNLESATLGALNRDAQCDVLACDVQGSVESNQRVDRLRHIERQRVGVDDAFETSLGAQRLLHEQHSLNQEAGLLQVPTLGKVQSIKTLLTD